MTAAIGLAAVALFAVAIRLLNVAKIAQGALTRSRAAMGVLRDGAKTDLEKEIAARSAGAALLASFLKISAGVCAAAAPAAALVALTAAAGLTTVGGLAGALSSPWMLAAACAVSVPAFVLR